MQVNVSLFSFHLTTQKNPSMFYGSVFPCMFWILLPRKFVLPDILPMHSPLASPPRPPTGSTFIPPSKRILPWTPTFPNAVLYHPFLSYSHLQVHKGVFVRPKRCKCLEEGITKRCVDLTFLLKGNEV